MDDNVGISKERRQLAKETDGWLTEKEGEALRYYAIGAVNSPTILEIGCYAGKSTIWLGDAAENIGARVVSIDNFVGVPSARNGKSGTILLTEFLDTINKAELSETVIPILGSSFDVYQSCYFSHDFVFIDGDHSAQAACRDAGLWGTNAHWVLFHDSKEPGVAQAIKQMGKTHRIIDQVDSLTVMQIKGLEG